MNFSLTEEHRRVQAEARAFAQGEIAPVARANDAAHRFDLGLLRRMGELGFLGASIPTEYGGRGLDYVSMGLICEELERVESAFRVVMSVHAGLNSLTLLQWGTEEQKRRFLVPQARGEKYGAYSLTEPVAGSDAAGIRLAARRDGDWYVLTGVKQWVSLGNQADHVLLIATIDPAQRHRGLCAFVVERDTPGFRSEPIEGKLGVRASDSARLFLEECRVPRENLIGREGEGFAVAMSALDWGRYTVAAGAVGLAQACLDASVDYCHRRQAFDQEIGRFQLVQEMIAEMVAGVEMARLLCRRVGWLKNHGRRTTRETSLAKWQACDLALRAADLAIEVHGAAGYTDEYPVERYWRNARGAVIYEGTREIHKLIQADYALGYRQDKPLRCPPPPAPGWTREETPDS